MILQKRLQGARKKASWANERLVWPNRVDLGLEQTHALAGFRTGHLYGRQFQKSWLGNRNRNTIILALSLDQPFFTISLLTILLGQDKGPKSRMLDNGDETTRLS